MTLDTLREKLTVKTKLLYGVAEFAVSMMHSAVQFFLMFYYTDVVGIDPAIAGTALLVGKLTWDAVNDPLVGLISDRMQTRFGRRRPFLILGAIPYGISIWIIFSTPSGLTGAAAFFAVIFTFLLFDTFHTAISVPYYAMTPELTHDYDERTSLTAYRKIFGVTGYMAGAILTGLVASIYQNSFGWTAKTAYSGMGATFGVISIIVVLITALTVKERSPAEVKPSELPLIDSVKITLGNKPFMRLVLAFVISSYSFTLMTGFFIYYMKYYLLMEEKFSLVMAIMMGALLIFLFFWKWVSDNWNKGPAYALGLFIACVSITVCFFLPHKPTAAIYVIAFVVGFGFSSQYVFPWSMLPDCIEHDQKKTGERREGVYYGVWAFLMKFASAAGVASIGWVLKLFDYAAPLKGSDAFVEQSVKTLLGMRLFFGPIPAIIMVASLPLLIWFPITRSTHRDLRVELGDIK
ncbi:MAG: MFS transporter [Deltaproteobacteria bacterium]|uniref:MFS transporter n=1 Tax=Candidatus Zymogenus saltonus TaxID=2844893 RepID=A0A9D8KF61_9DELT|nr:MFS transporter [Candidatus Zymogenus saltonus]